MSEEEAINALANLQKDDEERAHHQADDVLIAVLKANGLDSVAQAWEDAKCRIGFWYA